MNISTKLSRLRPTRDTLAALVALLWAISYGAVRDFVWADLRQGMMDVRGLSRVTRALIYLGFALLLLMVALLLFNDVWRARSALHALLKGTAGRGSLIPEALIPTSLFLLTMAWSFALMGALHTHPLLRLGVLTLYTLSLLQWIASVLIATSASELGLLAASLVALLLLFGGRWRTEPHPPFEFAATLLPVSLAFILIQLNSIEIDERSGIPLGLHTLHSNIAFYASLIFPLLALVGMDIARFAYQAAAWTTEIVQAHLSRAGLSLLLLVALGARLSTVLGEAWQRVAENSFRAEALGYLGALGIPLLAFLVVGAVRQRRPASEPLDAVALSESVEGRVFPLILLYHLPALATFALLALVEATLLFVHFPRFELGVEPLRQALFALSDRVQGGVEPWQTGVALVAVVATPWLTRRGAQPLALYLGLFGVHFLWLRATAPGYPLALLFWQGETPVDFWWVLVLAGVGALWLWRGELTDRRVTHLLLLTLLSGLLRQTNFIENPFSPFFAFAGIGFLAFGLIWDALTAGSWANVSTPALPRLSRIFLYLGYVLLTVTVVNWALATHDLTLVGRFTGDGALVGLDLFGHPLLYALIALPLFSSSDNEAGAEKGIPDDI